MSLIASKLVCVMICIRIALMWICCNWSEWFFSHDVVEVFLGDFTAVGGSPLEHFLELLQAHVFSQLLSHSLDIVHVNSSTSVIIEQVEYFVDALLSRSNRYFAFFVSEFGSDGINEFLEINLAAFAFQFGDHVVDGGVLALESQALHGCLQFSAWIWNYFGSILPLPSVSKRLKASLSS